MSRSPSPEEKKAIAVVIGNDLAVRRGKKSFYSQSEIKQSLKRHRYDIDWHCWAYCLYMDHTSFDSYHRSINESCDYLAMKESMVSSVTDSASDSWLDFDFDLSWLEFPDVDLSSIFDFIDL